ncbi:hypothetical protein WVIC16_60108 [Weissella viridescens]|nr:hypothetical protein WVIC16_60108 [Weissella viridescens]
MRTNFLEELIKLQSIEHCEEVARAIDIAYRRMYINLDTPHNIMMTLLMMLRRYAMLGLYSADDEEIEIIKGLCRVSRVRKWVRDAYISDFMKLKKSN